MNKQAEINKLKKISMQIYKNGRSEIGIASSIALFKGNNVNPVIITGLAYLKYMAKENLLYVRKYMQYIGIYLRAMRNAIAKHKKDKDLREDKVYNSIYRNVKNEREFNISEKSYFDDGNIGFKFYTKLIYNITCFTRNRIDYNSFFENHISCMFATNSISVKEVYELIQSSIIEYIECEKINYRDPLKTYPVYLNVFQNELSSSDSIVSLCLSYITFDLLGNKYSDIIYGGNDMGSYYSKFELVLLQTAMLHISIWCTSNAKNKKYLLISLSRDNLPYKMIFKPDGIYLNNTLFVKMTEISKFKILNYIHDNIYNYMITYEQASQIGLKKKCLQKHANELNKKFTDITCCNDEILVSQRGIGYKLKYRFLDDFKD